MKKFFTLIAAALLSSGAFAQTEWQKITTNTDMEGEQAEDWSSFWVHEWRTNDEQFDGFANIVEDPTDPTNHCAKVVIRSEADADAAGNKIMPDGQTSLASWDSQFLIYATEQIPSGKELRMTLRVRAEKAGMFETQAHQEPGNYNHYQLFGNINYTTDWQRIQITATIGTDHTQEANNKWMQSVAFNLSTMTDGNVIYFDDVKLEIRDPQQQQFEGWQNLIRKGTLSDDVILGSNFTNFTGRNGIDNTDRKAEVVIDTDGQPAMHVASIGWTTTETNPVLDEEGNPVLDEEGNPTYNTQDVYINEETGERLTSIDNWRTQFFITSPHKFKTGEKIRLVMWARADKETYIESQAHRLPGDYIHYELFGNLNLTTEWQRFEFEQEVTSTQSGSSTFQTVAFNCNVPKEIVNYYFRVEEFSANSSDVTFNERILATEDICLPVPDPNETDGKSVTIDFTKCMETLYAEDFVNLIDDTHTLVLQGFDEDGEIYSIPSSITTGLIFNEQGYYDENGKIIIEANPESDPDKAELTIYNDGESFQGKKANTKLAISYNGWYYLFNVLMTDAAGYQEWLGVSAATAAQPATAAIYDLTGRRVNKAVKGLYIQNGKKYFVR